MIKSLPIVLSVLFGFCVQYGTRKAQCADYLSHHENVLGTSLEIHVRCREEITAMRSENMALEEIDRLSAILSHYDSRSELSKLERCNSGESIRVSRELLEALQISDHWMLASHGAFNPAVQSLSELWSQGQAEGRVPDPEQLRRTAAEIQAAAWKFGPHDRSVHRAVNHPFTFDAFAKGMILDRVADHVLRNVDGVDGLMINIGGDLKIIGDWEVDVDVADPRSDAIGATPIANVTLSNQAIATSGNSERGFDIAGRTFSHIIDPRTGHPVEHITSATVIGADATTADAVATICNVLIAEEAIAFVDQIPHVDCLLVTSEGTRLTSENWPKKSSATKVLVSTNSARSDQEAPKTNMLIEFEIAKSDNSRRYRRPYVAVWIEDKDKFPVRTLSLFLMQNNPGPRWYRDLRRWYSDDQLRKLVDSRDMIKTVSKPTRNPGKYKVSWDGMDDSGAVVADGKYTLLIEAAREHGTYQLIKHEFELGKSFAAKLKGNAEISAASIKYESGRR